MMGFIRDGNYQMPLRPLEGTAPGHLFAEPVGHRRPFPKRRAVPYDRWRNRCDRQPRRHRRARLPLAPSRILPQRPLCVPICALTHVRTHPRSRARVHFARAVVGSEGPPSSAGRACRFSDGTATLSAMILRRCGTSSTRW